MFNYYFYDSASAASYYFVNALGYVIVGESECGFEDGSECFSPWFAVDTLA